MATHKTYIFAEDSRAQAAFYVQALGGEILSVMTHGELPGASEALKDKVLHLSLMAAGVNILMSDTAFGTYTPGNAINLVFEFATEAEAHNAFNNLAEGGIIKDALKPAFWGSLFGQVEDKYGFTWMITTEAKAS